jgi:uncharacterized protein YxeA
MKKIVLMLTMVFMLAFSAVCSASNGKVLDTEENMINKFLSATKYSAITSMMTEDMKKEFNEETFNNFREQLDKNFGKLNEKQLFLVEKGKDVDVLRYQSSFALVPEAQFVFMFKVENEKPLLAKFALALPPKEGAAEEQK